MANESVQGQVSVAAATAVAGYDIFRDEQWNSSDKPRILRKLRCAGSTAGGDCSFHLYIGSFYVGRFFVLAAGWPTKDHEVEINRFVPPGARIVANMVVAPTTNPINVVISR